MFGIAERMLLTSVIVLVILVVIEEQRIKHPLYSKVMIRSKRHMAHDEQNACSIGDRVLIEETRPLSAKKRWKLKNIISKSISI